MHAAYLWPVGIIYGFLNYSATQKQGYPVYSFLTWEDIWSPIAILFLNLMAVLFFFSLAFLTQLIKRGSKRDKIANSNAL